MSSAVTEKDNSSIGKAENDTPVVVLAADNNYALPLTMTLFSMLKNIRAGCGVKIFVLDGGLSDQQKSKIEEVLGPLIHPVQWTSVDASRFAHFPIHKHLSIATYYRLAIAELLPKYVRKAIYFDCDLLIEGDVNELWGHDPKDSYLMAVRGQSSKRYVATTPISQIDELVYDKDTPYFNAGVLILNIAAFRKHRVGEQAANIIEKYGHIIRHDQDALNAVCIGHWTMIDAKWNQYAKPARGKLFSHIPGGILHFTSAQKPWDPRHARFRRGEIRRNYERYHDYLKDSGWYSKPDWALYAFKRNYFKVVNLISVLINATTKRLLPGHFRKAPAYK